MRLRSAGLPETARFELQNPRNGRSTAADFAPAAIHCAGRAPAGAWNETAVRQYRRDPAGPEEWRPPDPAIPAREKRFHARKIVAPDTRVRMRPEWRPLQ